MKNEKVPIQRAREIAERHGWPRVIVIAYDESSGRIVGASYGIDRDQCKATGEKLDQIMAEQFGVDHE